MNKKLFFFLFIFSCFAIFNVGCGKDDDDNTSTTTLNNQLTAKVNGTAWSSNTTGYSVSISTTAKTVTIQTEGANDTQIYLLAKKIQTAHTVCWQPPTPKGRVPAQLLRPSVAASASRAKPPAKM
ncbi:MAG: hypothetical protein IPL35_00115 [Sphingobacteriales bacterium]|nr:hypothetical protein [Sphingobacteriales bacterium]